MGAAPGTVGAAGVLAPPVATLGICWRRARWVQRYGTEGAAAPSCHARSDVLACRRDHGACQGGRWCYLSRAINATGTTIDFGPDLATASQDLNAERRRHGFFRRGTQMFSSTEGR